MRIKLANIIMIKTIFIGKPKDNYNYTESLTYMLYNNSPTKLQCIDIYSFL